MKRMLLCAVILTVSVITLMWTEAHADVGRGDTGAEVTEVQTALRSFGYTVTIDGRYGRQTERAVRHFQRVNGLAADGVVGKLTDAALGTQPAVRLAPPPRPTFPGPCEQYHDAIAFFDPGWDETRMANIMYRESRCVPTAANSCCHGLFQINQSWIRQLGHCQVYSRADLYLPDRNVCAAAYVFLAQGIDAWSTA